MHIPEVLKEDVVILGVTGSFAGVDTSDATATADEIAEGKTAYVNGQKIVGTGKVLSAETYATILALLDEIIL